MLKFLILFFIFFVISAESKYQVNKMEKVDFDDPSHFEDSKYILDQIQKAEKIKKEKLEKSKNIPKDGNDPSQDSFNLKEEEKNIDQKLDEKNNIFKKNNLLIDPFEEINSNQKIEEQELRENIKFNQLKKDIYDNQGKKLETDKGQDENLLTKQTPKLIIKEDRNKIGGYINILANRVIKKQNPYSKKAVEKKIISYIRNQDFSSFENHSFPKEKAVEKKITATEDRFILTKPIFRTSNVVNARQIIENEKYIVKAQDEADKIYFKENDIKKKEEKIKSEKDLEKNIIQVENQSFKEEIEEKKKTNIKNAKLIRPYIKKDHLKKQILPTNLLEIKNYSIETYKDLYSVAFDAIGKNNSNEILHEIFSYLPFDNNELKDLNGNNLLIYAVLANDHKAIDILVKYGVSANDQNHEGNSALHVATSYGNQEAISLMSLSTITPNQKNNDGNTPLMFAAAFGDMNILQIMLENGGNLYIENKDGLNSIDIAEMNGHIELINQINLKYKTDTKSNNIELLDKINN